MKKRYLIGFLVSVFVMLSVPSVNAIEGNEILKEKDLDLYSKNDLDQSSIIEKLKNNNLLSNSYKNRFSFLFTLLIVIVIIYYFSGFIEEPETPEISFTIDDQEDSITVANVEEEVFWEDIDVQGECNTSNLSGVVKAGDKITECSGEISIVYIPTNETIGVFNFQ